MKKILTLLVMLLCGWGIVSAQTPAFGYQAVVRTADNQLVAEQQVNVTVTVTDAENHSFSETHTGLMTDKYGMVGILVGTGTATPTSVSNIEAIDWTTAIITTVFDVNNTSVTVNSGINAVPYALKAGSSELTTQQILNYIQDPNTTIEDYAEVMLALWNNDSKNETAGALWEWIKEKMVEFMKNNKDAAVDVAASYLSGMTADDVEWAYDAVKNSNPDAMRAAINILAEYALQNKDFAMDVLVSYVEQMDKNEAGQAAELIMAKETAITPLAVDFLKTHRTSVVNLAADFFASADATEVTNALTVFNASGMKQALVNQLFFTYLNEHYATAIRNRVNNKLQNDYFKKVQCDGEDVDICDILGD